MTVGVMTKLGAGQKEQIFWDTECPEEIVKAEARFQELVSAGYTAVKKEAGENGSSTDVQTKSFDETSPEIIMVPRLVGG